MDFDVGDLVTRKSHNNDTVFSITDIIDGIYYLSGLNVRLIADAFLDDLVKYDDQDVDGDSDYLKRCSKFYEESNIWAMCINESEDVIPLKIRDLLDEFKPNIVVITGHDAYYKKKGNINDLSSYKNSSNFIEAVKEARLYEREHDKLIIIAGACQSNYEELIKAGANFASSPKRINIHALDPAIIATKVSLSLASKDIDLKSILGNTKYGASGMGGIITKGTMYVGYPR